MKILVTGASGFIGRNLCLSLKDKGYIIRAALRRNIPNIPGVNEYVEVADIDESTDWLRALQGVDCVIHLAGRAHLMDEHGGNPATVYHRVNALGTKRLAEQAAQSGVKRFIFVSSVKVNGEGSRLPYTEKDVPRPQDAYGISKQEAEDLLSSIAAKTGLQKVILRLPLVYGPGVKANFKNLIKFVNTGLPLPFEGINNRRSFLYLGNLVGAIITCISHPLAAGETFLVSDGQDASMPDLIKMIARAMKKKAVLFSLHPGILKLLCKVVGRDEELEKITGSLFVDSGKIRNLLGWKPLFTLEEGIKETIKYQK